MSHSHTEPVVRWNVRYEAGGEPVEVLLPHVWRQDVSVSFEGPVYYQANVKIPRGKSHLLFHGVSYAAEVYLDGELALRHEGIWDAFAVPLSLHSGRTVAVEVRVTKNGGATFPVRNVASGFLPFVFQTFGGMFGMVELVEGDPKLEFPAAQVRTRVSGSQIFIDEKPFFLRGLLHWGWYPELGHPNPPDSVIREEVLAAKARGFNLVKFCLWVPSHRYLDILREEGMEAWIELPLWDPTDNAQKLKGFATEFERIVRQYRHHDNIVVWTVGCELGRSTPPEFREYMTQLIDNLTNCPLVKDSSGGSEMYGGDLREFGDLYDFHPYCDLPFYPTVLDSLLPGARTHLPILLGEFNDVDVHRDLSRLGDELPYWASTLPELNAKGVRWQYELPSVLADSRFANHPTKSRHQVLVESSRRKALFTRKTVQEDVRARDQIAGYVVTGWRDTPISSSGIFDDWSEARFSPEECDPWNGPTVLFLMPTRRPAWVNGGNRPGWIDPLNMYPDPVLWRVGVHSEHSLTGGLSWKIVRIDGTIVASGAESRVQISALSAQEVGHIYWVPTPGEYRLEVQFGEAVNVWPIWIVEEPELTGLHVHDPLEVFGLSPDSAFGGDLRGISSAWNGHDFPCVTFLTREGTIPRPFWREAAYEFRNDSFWGYVPFAEQWSRLLPVSPDRVLDESWLKATVGDYEVLLNRVDTRTYADSPVLIRHAKGLITTLRPFGGLGSQPGSLATNPAGATLLRSLVDCLAVSI